MRKFRLTLKVLVGLLLAALLLISCTNEASIQTPWLKEIDGRFQTNDLEQAQSNIPFELVLPTYLPDNLDCKTPYFISWPANKDNSNEVSVTLDYGEDDGKIFDNKIYIEISNYIIELIPEQDSDPTFLNISGITVLFEKFKVFADSVDIENISILSYHWNQDSFHYWVEVYNYDEDISQQIVESIIKQSNEIH